MKKNDAVTQNSLDIYERLHTSFAMSYGEVCQLRQCLLEHVISLREEADKIEETLGKKSDAKEWYKTISQERDALREALR